MKLIELVLLLAGCFQLVTWSSAQAVEYIQMDIEDLRAEVKKLNIGFGDYKLSHKLTDAQKVISQKNPVRGKSYKGTYKFRDQDINIVVEKETDLILALFVENDNATKKQFRELISTLMMEFEEPTTMAHDQLIYWAYNGDGLIGQELYDAMRKENELNILATVKFSSKVHISDMTRKEKDKKTVDTEEKASEKADNAAKEEQKNSIYCIVSSPPLLSRYIAEHK